MHVVIVMLFILDLESITVTVQDISSIKFDVSSNPNAQSILCIQVRPSFKAESFPASGVLGYTSKFLLDTEYTEF